MMDLVSEFDVRVYLGPNWDLYLITLLALVLGFVMVIQRRR